MTLNFTNENMVHSLTKLGYVIKEEKEIESVRTYHDNTEEVERSVYNVYYYGVKMAEFAGFNMRRVQYVFEQELHKKLINLF